MMPNPWMEVEMAHRRSAARFGRAMLGLAKVGIVLYLVYALLGAMPQWIVIALALAICVWIFYGRKA